MAKLRAGIGKQGRHPRPAPCLRHPLARSPPPPAHGAGLLGHHHISTTVRYFHLSQGASWPRLAPGSARAARRHVAVDSAPAPPARRRRAGRRVELADIVHAHRGTLSRPAHPLSRAPAPRHTRHRDVPHRRPRRPSAHTYAAALERITYNSCRNRHCSEIPAGGQGALARAARRRDVLPIRVLLHRRLYSAPRPSIRSGGRVARGLSTPCSFQTRGRHPQALRARSPATRESAGRPADLHTRGARTFPSTDPPSHRARRPAPTRPSRPRWISAAARISSSPSAALRRSSSAARYLDALRSAPLTGASRRCRRPAPRPGRAPAFAAWLARAPAGTGVPQARPSPGPSTCSPTSTLYPPRRDLQRAARRPADGRVVRFRWRDYADGDRWEGHGPRRRGVLRASCSMCARRLCPHPPLRPARQPPPGGRRSRSVGPCWRNRRHARTSRRGRPRCASTGIDIDPFGNPSAGRPAAARDPAPAPLVRDTRAGCLGSRPR